MIASALLWLAACAATANPDLEKLEPVSGPQPAATAAPVTPETGGEAQDPAPAQPAAPAVGAATLVGSVGGEGIDVQEFLSRLWVRDSGRVREVLEQIVFERLTLLEAERLGLAVDPADVDRVLADAYASMGAKLTEQGSQLTVAEHIRQNLGMDPAFYEQHMRSDAIVQLLAERCVRAWALENERTVVEVLDLAGEDALHQVQEGLDAGRDFADLAAEFGTEKTPDGKPPRLSLVRSESHPLARLAFATEVGAVGGPLVQGSGYLLLRVVERLDPETSGSEDTPGTGPDRQHLEASLAAEEVDNLEFVQWRAAMVRRYDVDLAPLFELVGDPGP